MYANKKHETLSVLRLSLAFSFVGDAVSGGLTYLTLKPCAIKLKDNFKSLNLSDSELYYSLALELEN